MRGEKSVNKESASFGSAKDVNTKTKLSALLLAALVLGVAALAVSAVPNEDAIAPQAGQEAQTARKLLAKRFWLGGWFLKNGVPAQIEGTIIAHTPGVTVLEVDGEYINVLTPGRWLVDGKIVLASDLFSKWAGKEASMETLKVEKTWNVKVTAYAVYKITVDGVTAQSILAVNIENP